MIHRQNNVLLTDASGDANFAASYTVIACPVGAVASAASSGTTATVDAGHGFRAADKVLIWDGSTATFVAEALNSVTATTLVWSSATPTIAKTNLLVNLGPDTASGATPAYDASPMYVFTDADGDDAITNSTITCDTQGNYDYWTQGDGRNWELIRDSAGTVAGVVPGWGGKSGQLNPCDYGCVADNSTNNSPRMKVAIDAAADSGQTFHGPAGDFRVGAKLLLPANFTAVNDPLFRLVKAFNGTMLISETLDGAAAGASTSDDNIWWQGGRMTVTAADTWSGGMFGIHSDGGMLRDFIIEEWGNNASGGIGGHLYGNYGWIDNVQAYSTVTAVGGTDGLGRAAGIGGGIVNCRVRCADDCYTTSIWYGNGVQDVGCSDMVIANNYGESYGARLFHIGTATSGATTTDVERITVSNLTGTTGANALTRLTISNASDSGSIKNIKIDGLIGSCNTTNAAVRIVDVDGSVGSGSYQIQDVHISNVHASATTNATPVQGQVRFLQVNRGSFSNSSIDASSINAAMDEIVWIDDCKNVDVRDNHFLMSTTAATGAIAPIQLSNSTGTTGGVISGNTIIDLPDNGIGIYMAECTGYTVTGNNIRIASGATEVNGIFNGGGAVEGNNVIADNNLSDWLALESAENAAGTDYMGDTKQAIVQLNEGDTAQWNNIGHDPIGFEPVTAGTTQTQAGGTFIKARTNNVTVSNEDDTITLPFAVHGREVVIIRDAGANDLKIYPAFGDSIITVGGVNLGANTPGYYLNTSIIEGARFIALNKTNWLQISGATLSATS